MEFSWVFLVRALHVTAAALWFGGSALGVLLIGPAAQAAGESGKGFMAAIQKKGGFARIMGPAAITAILTGLLLFYKYGYHRDPFGTIPSGLLTAGAIIGAGGWIYGTAFGLPLQKKMTRIMATAGAGGPTPEQAATMGRLQMTLARRGRLVAATTFLAFVLMAGRNVVA